VTSGIVVLADDLSGAAESAAAIGIGTVVRLWQPASRGEVRADGPALVIDTGTRVGSPAAARRATTLVMAGLASSSISLLVKIDSLLRGHSTELAALAAGRTTFVCPALPALGRRVIDGQVLVDDRPLGESPAWRHEGRPAPASVAAWLAPLPTHRIGLRELREPRPHHVRPGAVHVCDAETEADVEAIAALAHRTRASLVAGSSLLIAATARRRPYGDGSQVSPSRTRTLPRQARGVLLVVGTASPEARAQADRLRNDPRVVHVPVDELLSGRQFVTVEQALRAGRDVVVGWAEDLRTASDPAVLSHRLARRLAPVITATGADLFLTGGQTARSVLDEIGTQELTVLDEVPPGAVISAAEDGRLVGTRPGSFGGPDALSDVLAALRRHRDAAGDPDPKGA